MVLTKQHTEVDRMGEGRKQGIKEAYPITLPVVGCECSAGRSLITEHKNTAVHKEYDLVSILVSRLLN